MDLSYGEAYEKFRDEVKAFLAANWPPSGEEAELPRQEQVDRFRERGVEAGMIGRGVPRAYGGSEQQPDVLKAQIIREECARTGAPGDVASMGTNLVVPTLLAHGSDEQKERFIKPTIRGHIRWCQGYSEPGSGSDLASLQTRAELVGDEWVINGQKIWTSGAQFADYMFLLCRTEPEMPKHAGISYLLLDMKQPGVDVRPLKQMTGASGFNEVFFTNAKTPRNWIVGKRGEGWIVSRTTLKHERHGFRDFSGVMGDLPRLVELAQKYTRNGRPAIEDPQVRQQIAQIEGYMRARLYSLYYRLSRSAKNMDAGALDLMEKLSRTNIGQMVAKLGMEILGDDGLLEPPSGRGGPDQRQLDAQDASARGWVRSYLGSLGSAIAAGSSNIQRNVIAERGLGLPRDYYASSHK